jgi:cytochrome b
MNRNQLKQLISEAVRHSINESGLFKTDEELKAMTENKLEEVHKTLNNLLMILYANSQKSIFAKSVFDKIKQADDAILVARRDF